MANSLREISRFYSIDRANATLPLVRVIVADIQRLSAEIQDRRERFDRLVSGRSLRPRSSRSSDPYAQELAEFERDLAREAGRLQEFTAELRALGVNLCDANHGSVDFPGLLEGQRVHLCWKLGETEVLYYHQPGESFTERRPLVAGTLAEPMAGSDGGYEG